MKSKEFAELKNKSIESLKKEVEKLVKEKNEAKVERDMTKAKDLHKISKIRHNMAQIMTLINEKSFAEKETKNVAS